MKKAILLFLLAAAWSVCFAQNTIGQPDIINYSIEVIKGAQNRQVKQDKRGILYFANNEGVLTFDGVSWKAYPLPNKSIVRSLEFGFDHKLYVGGQDEIGYFSPSSNGRLYYQSIRPLIPAEDRSFTDVWNIVANKDGVFFQTSDKIFQYKNDKITVYKTTQWRFLSAMGDKLVAQDIEKGLLHFTNGVWAPFLKESELPNDFLSTSICTIGQDSFMLTTHKNGIFIIHDNKASGLASKTIDYLKTRNISSSTMVNDKHIAIGTNLDGCHIIDKQGELVRSFNRKQGLQNNNILDVFLDKEKNLWLGLDNGIDFLPYNNAIKHIYPEYLNEGSGYASYIYKNELYIGTSHGLYKLPLSSETDIGSVKAAFTPVANSAGQVWNLSEVNGKLLMGHHEGAFLVENNQAHLIDKGVGFWNFLPYHNVLPSSVMITGTYEGVNFYHYENDQFSPRVTTAKFESSRYVVIINDKIWIAHPYKGIYAVQLKNNQPVVKQYAAKEGVASVNGNYIFRIDNTLILTTENGVFEYNAGEDRFVPNQFYNQLFGNKSIRYLKEDQARNVWFVFDKTLGVIDNSSSKPQIIYFPELTNKFVAGFEHINPIDKNNVLMGGEKGFYHINYEQYKQIKYPLQVQITSVVASNEKDSLLFGGYVNAVNEDGNTVNPVGEISHKWNSFQFQFAAPLYAQQSVIEYSYILEGFETKWSEFSKKTEKEYTNLPAGNYTFKVKAKNNLGNESAVTSYNFIVLPPWYQTYWAYGFYFIMVSLGMYFFYREQKKKFIRQQLKHEKEQKQLQYLHQLELDKAEKELVQLRNEKLEAEIQHKNTELASTAMHLVQKGEILGKVKEQMLKLKKHSEGAKDADELKKILRTLSEEDKMDQQWEQFSVHFDNVHSDFLSVIKAKYPSLSANELKTCAYLRMNLTTKEIAQLMNISVRGVEISRYRLRKKLGLPTEVSLLDFMMEVTTKQAEPQ